ncbi:hypothetical protein AKJ48_03725 [candidate division MSBL1 archaeon SCGC-AAA261O19]|uniref:Uncharacterized protein n=1 Tax=candidate division MSBL1 archaeon SCGC-AAA261O19 TaxID=1698277 RepID=A0A133VB26_9EURY|nr:hypothetical protein AKJ48_03725 [candidate division MSBL1 archaeon SCGC-AAA261O19]
MIGEWPILPRSPLAPASRGGCFKGGGGHTRVVGKAMKRKKAEELLREAFEEYQGDPRNWAFWVSTEPSRPEVYLIHGGEAYFLKVDSIYTPKPVGVGTKFRVEEDQLSGRLPESGFRRLSRRDLEEIFSGVPRPEELESGEELERAARLVHKRLRERVSGKRPIPFGPPEPGDEAFAVGPYAFGDPLEYVSGEQRRLKRELARELERLERMRHPEYG